MISWSSLDAGLSANYIVFCFDEGNIAQNSKIVQSHLDKIKNIEFIVSMDPNAFFICLCPETPK